jgi:hypothetical protein
VIDRGGDDFGTTVGNQMSVAELQDAMTLWSTRMSTMTQKFADMSPAWVARDSGGYTAWTNDWNKLQARYKTALDAANSVVLQAKLSVFTPNSAIPAQAEYDGLAKAMRQCYPPDGCPTVASDWADLFNRMTAAAQMLSVPVPTDTVVQPTATDLGQQVFAATAPLDAVAQATGAQEAGPLPTGLAKALQGAPNLGGGWAFLSWLVNHKTGVLIGVVTLVGGLIVVQLLPLLMVPAKIVKGIAAVAA